MSSVQELLLASRNNTRAPLSPFLSLVEGAAQGYGESMANAPERMNIQLQIQARQVAMEQAKQDFARKAEAQKDMEAKLRGEASSHATGLIDAASVKGAPVTAAGKVASETIKRGEDGYLSSTTTYEHGNAGSDGKSIQVTPAMAAKYEGLIVGSIIPSTFLAEFGQKKGLADAKAEKAGSIETTAQNSALEQAQAQIVKVDQALKNVSGWSTGWGGATVGKLPGSQAKDLQGDLDTIKANLGFSTLAEMKRASPSGGALGAISESEMRLLTSARESLDREQSPAQLRRNLNAVKTHYTNWANAVMQARGQGGNSKAAPAVASKANHDALLDKYGAP